MSMSVAFWGGGNDLPPVETYRRLNALETVEGVDTVDRASVERVFAESLAGWTWDGQFLSPPGGSPAGGPSFDVFIGEQMVEFSAAGVQVSHVNAVIDAMHELGLPLFDPQTGERFA